MTAAFRVHRRPYHRAARTPRTAAGIVLLIIATIAAGACASARADRTAREARAVPCTADRPGVLRIANFTGYAVDIYALRPLDHWRVFVAQVSIGTTELPVPGPEDLGVRYDAVEPARGQALGTVTWIRPASRGGASSNFLLELQCADSAT